MGLDRRLVAICCSVLLAACGARVPGASSDALTEDECGQLMEKIDEVMASGLSSDEAAQMRDTPEERAEATQQCVEDAAWDRAGFECAMEATSESDLKACIWSS